VQITPPSPGRPPTSGTSKSASGKNTWPSRDLSPSHLSSRFATLSFSQPLPAHACSPELALQPLQRRGRLGQGHSTEADLLRLHGARSKGLLAWGDHSHLGGADQRPRALRRPPARRGNLWPSRRRAQLPLAQDPKEELAGVGVEHLVPYSSNKLDPNPKTSALRSRLRYRIDTVFSELTER
jgi:hypothetical protein